MPDSPLRSGRPIAAAIPLTAAASLVLVLAATARANLGGAVVDRPANGVDVVVPTMLPGRSTTSCAVIVDDPTPGTVLRFSASASGELARYLDVSIRRGPPDASCTQLGSTVPIYAGALTDLERGAGATVPFSQRVARAPYVFEVSLPADTANDAQGARAAVALRWEVMPVGAER